MSDDNNMMAVEVSTSGVFRAGIPEVLFSGAMVRVQSLSPNYDVSADGRQFVVSQVMDEGEMPTITLVQNWYAEFKEP